MSLRRASWGCGWVASGHINAYLQHPDCDLIALGSRREESVRAKQAEFGIDTAVYTDFDELLEDDRIDMVSICTPNFLHASETIRAAQAGKHIFIEKPIATTPEDIADMCDAVEQAGVRTLVGFVLRFNPLVKLQRKLVAEGELGKVFLLNVDYWFGRERPGWMAEKEATGEVRIRLYKGQAEPVGRRSSRSLYRQDLATFGEGMAYTSIGLPPAVSLSGLAYFGSAVVPWFRMR